MIYLSNTERARIISCLVEGDSMRGTCRMIEFSQNTITRLLVQMGEACRLIHH
jgi:hypothetical protein